MVGVLPLGMLGVGLLYGEDTRSVYLLYLDAPGAMHNPLLIYQDTHMRNRCIAHWGRGRLARGNGGAVGSVIPICREPHHIGRWGHARS